ncbi:MAG: DUF421 domain-containing protein [Bacilli bacterium]|nr:DUF421 domain-containing protein [Bacilli bacterium]
MQLFMVVFRTVFFYFFITFVYRIMGKREVGQLGIIDLIVSILIAELVAISIEKTNQSIVLTIVPIFIIVLIEIGLAFLSIKSRRFRNLIQGKPSMIICDGKINYHELINQRYSLDDLLINLRQNRVKSIEEVEYAFLENNGKLSIFTYADNINKKVFPLPIIVDGKIEDKYLSKTPYSTKQLLALIKNNNLSLDNIFYGFFQDKKIFIIEKSKKNTFLDNKYLK